MKLMFRYALLLDNIRYEDISQPERIAIGKAIFYSLKYNATTNSTLMGLGESYIDSVEVDGYFTVSEYVDMAGVLVQGRVLRNTEERSGDLTASTYSLSSFFESVGDFFSKFMGTPSSSMRRSMTSQAYLEINTNLLTSERYKSACTGFAGRSINQQTQVQYRQRFLSRGHATPGRLPYTHTRR